MPFVEKLAKYSVYGRYLIHFVFLLSEGVLGFALDYKTPVNIY